MAKRGHGLRPGTRAPLSGQYLNPKTGTEVTSVRGEPLPPSPVKGTRYLPVDPTRHRARARK